MKILKLLNKKNLSIIIIFLASYLSATAEEQPIDIWNIEKKEISTTDSETNISNENENKKTEGSIYGRFYNRGMV